MTTHVVLLPYKFINVGFRNGVVFLSAPGGWWERVRGEIGGHYCLFLPTTQHLSIATTRQQQQQTEERKKQKEKREASSSDKRSGKEIGGFCIISPMECHLIMDEWRRTAANCLPPHGDHHHPPSLPLSPLYS